MEDIRGRILIVEDDIIAAKGVAALLESYDYVVVGNVAFGEDVLDCAIKSEPDLILMDIRLQGQMDGVEAAKCVRDHLDIPLIFLSAYSHDEVLARAIETVPAGYLVKPYDIRVLHSSIQIALRRHQMERKLQESEARFAGILEMAGDAIIVADDGGRIHIFNHRAEQVFGASAAEMVGRPVTDLLAPEFASSHRKTFTVVADIEKGNADQSAPQHYQLRGRRQDGTIFPFESTVSSISYDGQEMIIVVIRDITDRVQTELAMRRYTELLSSLGRLSVRLNATLKPDHIFSMLGEEFGKLGIICLLTLVDPHAIGTEILTYISIDAELMASLEQMIDRPLLGTRFIVPRNVTYQEIAFFENAHQFADDGLTDIPPEILTQLATFVGLGDQDPFLRVPLMIDDKPVGGLMLWGPGLDDRSASAYGVFASQLAVTIENARLLEAERIAREQAETLREVAAILNVSLDLERVLNLILQQVGRVIPFDTASVMVIDGDEVEIVARHGEESQPDDETWTRIPAILLPGIVEIMQTHQPVFIGDTLQDSRWMHMEGLKEIRSWMGVPLLANDQMIGVLNLNKDQPGFYHESDLDLALAFANQAKLAIQNARFFSDLEGRVADRTHDLETLYELTAIISRYLHVDSALDEALQYAVNTLDCQTGAIYLVQDEGADSVDAAEVVKSNSVPEPETDQPQHDLSNNVIRHVLTTGEPTIFNCLIPNCDQDHTYATVPMRASGRILGVLALFRNCSTPFKVEDVALLGTIGDHMGVAVENGRLRRQAEVSAIVAERERLGRDLHDSVTQQLYSLTLFTEALRERLMDLEDPTAQEFTAEISETAKQALREMRLLLYELREGTLTHDGLVNALRFRLEAVEKRSGMSTDLVADPSIKLPIELEKGLHLIAQEALNNVLKHAQASKVQVQILHRSDQVTLEIIDDGRGIFPSTNGNNGGMGIENMQLRVEKLGGELTIDSTPGQGTRLHATLPLSEPLEIQAPLPV